MARPSRPKRSRPGRAPRVAAARRSSRPGAPAATWGAAAVVIALYLPSLGYGFLLDDFVLFQTSPSLRELASIPRGFMLDVGAIRHGTETVISSYYRPLFLALSTLYYQAVGGNPLPWHLANVALAGAIAALACRFLLRQGLEPRMAALVAMAFSLHPSHASSIAWASGLQELLAALFVFLALDLAEPNDDTAPPARRLVLPAVFFAAALLCKEVSIGLLPWTAARALAARGRPDTVRRWRLTGVFTAITAAYLGLRIAVLGGLAQPPEGAPALARALVAVPVALFTYLRLLVAPLGFSIFRPERPRYLFGDPAVVIAVVALLALALASVWVIRKRPELFPPLAWILVWLLPALNLWALDPQWMVTDRYLFLPALGLPWLLALLLHRRQALGVLAAISIVFAGLTLRYEAIFHDSRTFLAAMEAAEPTSPLVFAEKGRLLRQDGNVRAARAALERAVELDPIAPGALIGLGDIELDAREFAAAERHYRQSLVVRPDESRGFKLLALALARAGQREQAFALAEENARRWPADFQVQVMQAVFLAARGERNRAESALALARRLRPDDPTAAGGLDAVLARLAPSFLPGATP